MDIKQLITAGLQPPQAAMYLLLLDKGIVRPSEAATQLQLTRTNAYKILDRLVENGLAKRETHKNKVSYRPTNPIALTNMVMENRNRVMVQENAVKLITNKLVRTYYKNAEQPLLTPAIGKEAVIQAYYEQINLRQPVYFIRSQLDIANLGFDTIHTIRLEPAKHGQLRYGITPDVQNGPINPPLSDKVSNLTRTWYKCEDYTAPVEWSVSGSSLLIVIFGEEPQAITINNPIVADAFQQLWALLDSTLRTAPYYSKLPRSKSQ